MLQILFKYWIQFLFQRKNIQILYNPVPQSELATVAFHFGEYLLQCSHHTSVVSKGCKFVYNKYLPARDILSRHGRLRGLAPSCPYLFLSGGAHGGAYNKTVESDLFLQSKQSLPDSL